MSVYIDTERANKLANILFDSFSNEGILGQNEMPEDILPEGVERGSLEHVLFITLTVSIDYMRDAPSLWESSRKTFEDPETRYLFQPQLVYKNTVDKIRKDMQKYGLAKRYNNDVNIWRTNSITFHEKWDGNPLNFLEDCGWDSLNILKRLKSENHLENNRNESDFPFLRGPKIGPLWIRMLRDNVGISKLENLDKVPIPVDIHVARSSLAIGVVRGEYEGKLTDIFENVRKVWFEGVKGLKIGGRDMIALDVDEPLWHLSKHGCSHRSARGRCNFFNQCEAKEFCVKGKITINKDKVSMRT